MVPRAHSRDKAAESRYFITSLHLLPGKIVREIESPKIKRNILVAEDYFQPL
jgi:hypothetical protein